MILRHGLKVRGLEFRLYYPKPRSVESAAAKKHGENRITFRPHFYFGETNEEIDFVFFLNGLPIVALEVKHEKNQNVQTHRDDLIYLKGAYQGQVNGEIQVSYNDLARYDELADPKYTDTGGIFDIMAITVIETHLSRAA
jgi:hypothetical protein